ncbi:MAG: type II secretion system protein M [Spongiibacteraceae bacterium]
MPLLNKFRELNRRDQTMLVLLAIALAIYVFYQAAWRPLAAANSSLARGNAGLRETVQSMTALAAEYQQLRQAGVQGTATQETLAQLLDRTVAAHQLQMSRFQPGSSGDVQIRFDNSSFDQIARWLHQLENESVTVRDLAISPGASTGLVNVSVRLFRA